MKNNKMTPGPWHVEKDWKTVWQDTGGPGNAEYAKQFPIWLIVNEQPNDPRLRTCVAQLDNSTEVEANAKAISALPDLIEALNALANAANPRPCCFTTCVDKEVEQARAALKKAGVL